MQSRGLIFPHNRNDPLQSRFFYYEEHNSPGSVNALIVRSKSPIAKVRTPPTLTKGACRDTDVDAKIRKQCFSPSFKRSHGICQGLNGGIRPGRPFLGLSLTEIISVGRAFGGHFDENSAFVEARFCSRGAVLHMLRQFIAVGWPSANQLGLTHLEPNRQGTGRWRHFCHFRGILVQVIRRSGPSLRA